MSGQHQAIIWTNEGLVLIGPLGTNFSEIWMKVLQFLYTKMNLKKMSTKWRPFSLGFNVLTHWGGVTYIYLSKQTSIGSDNGLLPDRRQTIIWTSARILLTGPSGTDFSEILIKTHTFSFKKMHLKMSSGKWLPFCLSLNVLNSVASSHCYVVTPQKASSMQLSAFLPYNIQGHVSVKVEEQMQQTHKNSFRISL